MKMRQPRGALSPAVDVLKTPRPQLVGVVVRSFGDGAGPAVVRDVFTGGFGRAWA
jgi:hypothetical protein